MSSLSLNRKAKSPRSFWIALAASVILHGSVFFVWDHVKPRKEPEPILQDFILVDAVVLKQATPSPPPPEEPPIEQEIVEEIPEVNDAFEIEEEDSEEKELEEVPEKPEKPEEIVETPSELPETTASNENFSETVESPENFIPFYKVDKKPQFIHEAVLRYPPLAKKNNIEGVVIVEAAIDKEGTLIQVKILKKAGYGFDESASAMLENSSFTPAYSNGMPVGVKMRFTIRFELD